MVILRWWMPMYPRWGKGDRSYYESVQFMGDRMIYPLIGGWVPWFACLLHTETIKRVRWGIQDKVGNLYKPPFSIIEEGRAVCHREPRDGEHGLEGYNEGETYRFQRVKNRDGTHMRVYPEHPDGSAPGYYECCGSVIFLNYFKVV